MEWLDGHPLSMRLILPHLDTTDPEMLVAGLRGISALPDRDDVLTASITYSVDHLTPTARRLLAAVSLFQGVAHVGVLGFFSQLPDIPERFDGCSTSDWTQVLDQAAGVGLLTPLGGGMYGIHPALPAYLASQWRHDEPDNYDQQRAAAEAALLDSCTALGDWLYQQIRGGDAAFAFTVIDHQRRTLGSLLGYALDHSLWDQAQSIAQPLSHYWVARGLNEEALGWTDRARLALENGDGTPPALDDPAGALWLLFVGDQAVRQRGARQLDAAERTYLQIRDMLQQQPGSPQQSERLATAYHHLGVVAQDRGRLEDAEDWYRQSLTITEQLGNRLKIASSYHQLGTVALDRGRLEDAEDWYRQSLTINGDIGDRPGIALNYHQLGAVAWSGGTWRTPRTGTASP